jgi:uncharacterized protein (TIGR00730 family)
MIEAVCVYCGSNPGGRPVFADMARQFGTALAEAGLTLVYGGGKAGLMGAVADAALSAGGRVIGVIPQLLMQREVGHHGLHALHVVDDMHQRKKMMADLSDAFVTLPGGAGTLEELFEMFTWAQLGYHAKPLALLNVEHYFDPLLEMLRHTVDEGFMRRAYLELLHVADTPAALLQQLGVASSAS